MAFSEEAQRYQETFEQWSQLSTQEVDESLQPILDTAMERAVELMAQLSPRVSTEFAECALGTDTAKRARLEEQMTKIASLSQGLLEPEDIIKQKEVISRQYPVESPEEKEFAQAYSVTAALGSMIGYLTTADHVEMPIDEDDKPEELALKTEYMGNIPILTSRETLFLVGTLVGRGDKVEHIREMGIDIPNDKDLRDMWYLLKDSLPNDEREEIESLFSVRSELNNKIVRSERKASADRVIQIIEAKELEKQFEHLVGNSVDLDPRCLVLDFLDGVDATYLPFLHELLSRVADPTVPIVNMAGRITEHCLVTNANQIDPSAPTLEPEAKSAIIEDVKSDEDQLREVIKNSYDAVIEFFKLYGYEIGDLLHSTDLNRFPSIDYGKVTKAKTIKGLLSKGACKTTRGSRYSIHDLVALAVYSAQPSLFSRLEELSDTEQKELRSTVPRDIKAIINTIVKDCAAGDDNSPTA